MTEGWSDAFHRHPDCRWLANGQRMVERRGGDPAPVVPVALQVALGRGKLPCLACFAEELSATT